MLAYFTHLGIHLVKMIEKKLLKFLFCFTEMITIKQDGNMQNMLSRKHNRYITEKCNILCENVGHIHAFT